eukprot:3478511-Amphidinium_carterae.1
MHVCAASQQTSCWQKLCSSKLENSSDSIAMNEKASQPMLKLCKKPKLFKKLKLKSWSDKQAGKENDGAQSSATVVCCLGTAHDLESWLVVPGLPTLCPR